MAEKKICEEHNFHHVGDTDKDIFAFCTKCGIFIFKSGIKNPYGG